MFWISFGGTYNECNGGFKKTTLTNTRFKHKHRMRVRWKECDAQGIAFYGSYLDFIDVSETEYFRNLDILLHDEKQREEFDLVVVKLNLEYKSPARIDDVIDVYLSTTKMGNTSVSQECKIYHTRTQTLILNGKIISVNFDQKTGKSRPIPDRIRNIIKRFEDM